MMMFIIYENSTGTPVDVSESIRYVKTHSGAMIGVTSVVDASHVYFFGSDMVYGLWMYTVVETATVPEGLTANPEKRAIAARAQRDTLLTACDWTQCLDAPIDTDSQLEYRAYRQALRDVTEQEGFPFDVAWPDLPETVKADPDPVDEAVDLMLNGEEVTENA